VKLMLEIIPELLCVSLLVCLSVGRQFTGVFQRLQTSLSRRDVPCVSTRHVLAVQETRYSKIAPYSPGFS
jgi:hypothetical protein